MSDNIQGFDLLGSVINSEYEYIALHRDVGETELKQVARYFKNLPRILIFITYIGKRDQKRREPDVCR
jgi:hypothetical protein